MINWLRTNVYASGVLALIRLYLGWQWLTAGWHKITAGFDATKYLTNAVNKPVLETGTNHLLYPNFVGFLQSFALPNVDMINLLIPWGEFFVGLGLLLGVFTSAAAFFGLLMNFMFMFAGTVSSNPWMILLGFFLIAAGANAGKWGGDYWLVPWIRNHGGKLFAKQDEHTKRRPPNLRVVSKI